MSLNFQQVRDQVKKLGENVSGREQEFRERRELARRLLHEYASNLPELQKKVRQAAIYDPGLRCALPVQEKLDAACDLPQLPGQATILAADGSQITPDRHAEVNYCLINVGAIQARHGSPEPPAATIKSELLYDEDLLSPASQMTEAHLALQRDLRERRLLAELAEAAPGPVLTFTDGPMELWGGKDGDTAQFEESLKAYISALGRLCALQAATAGYVDKPGANLVVRLLEVALTDDAALPGIHDLRPLHGVSDFQLFHDLLQPGQRSAIFAIQSQSAKRYQGPLALHFFYLNVGRSGHPWLARVEIPAWVAEDPALLQPLHAVLIQQCRVMGSRPYPYLLHRAHETALVTLLEKDQVTQMILLELRRRGLPVGEVSYKQSAKGLAGRSSMG